jgi:hypothetical protein
MRLFRTIAILLGGLLPFVATAADATTVTYDWILSGPAAGLGGFTFTGTGTLTVTTGTNGDTVTGVTGSLTNGTATDVITGLASTGALNSNDNLLFPIGTTFAGPPHYVSVSNLDDHGLAFITAAGIFDIFGFDQPNTTPAPSPTGNNYGELTPGGFGGVGHFDITATPLPAALPLLAGGLGVIGLLARRKKRRAQGAVGAG